MVWHSAPRVNNTSEINPIFLLSHQLTTFYSNIAGFSIENQFSRLQDLCGLDPTTSSLLKERLKDQNLTKVAKEMQLTGTIISKISKLNKLFGQTTDDKYRRTVEPNTFFISNLM